MTEVRPARKARWSRGQIRLLAWVSGSAAFVAVAGIVGISPKPAVPKDVTAAGLPRPVQQKVIVRRIIRRVVIVDAPKPTYTAGTPTYSSSSSGGGTTLSGPAPAPPAASTGGSAPP